MVELSIIIPAYNAEPFIFELVERLKPQITNTELIIIDDGSTKPLDIPDVKIIHKQNG